MSPATNNVYYVLSDHLGSTSVVTDANGGNPIWTGYYPFGETRYSTGTLNTDRLYTGQQQVAGIGLYNYKARYYDPYLNRFISADTLTPGGPQGLNRYTYGLNNPLKYRDPSGHVSCVGENWDDGPQCLKDKKSDLSIVVANTQYQNECAAGLRSECPGGAAGMIIYGIAGVTTVGIADYLLLGGAGADGVATAITTTKSAVTAAINTVKTAATAAVVKALTDLATHNPDSTTVSLGSNEVYQAIGESQSYTYFDLPEQVFKALQKLGIADKINYEFISRQIEQGKNFVITFTGAAPGAGTQTEIGWIEASGIYLHSILSISSPYTTLFYTLP